MAKNCDEKLIFHLSMKLLMLTVLDFGRPSISSTEIPAHPPSQRENQVEEGEGLSSF
jgi:hypothetical protein